ncbi:hypothetical protein [Burkholderia sp. GbtcB21]|uniref:hypothetical protein n=1 Tax=Burkholderia sp. GbtcB21 TaxID=2824766 RepID=UPI001C30C1D1|nr:hypothetical protein [Burkholderia sp. GbtcB21]
MMVKPARRTATARRQRDFGAFPGIFFRVAQCECVIFSDIPALPFHSAGKRLDDYKSKLK